jgi:hypothetical protein
MLLGDATLRSALASGIRLLQSMRCSPLHPTGRGGEGLNGGGDGSAAPSPSVVEGRGNLPGPSDLAPDTQRPTHARMRPLQSIDFRDVSVAGGNDRGWYDLDRGVWRGRGRAALSAPATGTRTGHASWATNVHARYDDVTAPSTVPRIDPPPAPYASKARHQRANPSFFGGGGSISRAPQYIAPHQRGAPADAQGLASHPRSRAGEGSDNPASLFVLSDAGSFMHDVMQHSIGSGSRVPGGSSRPASSAGAGRQATTYRKCHDQ